MNESKNFNVLNNKNSNNEQKNVSNLKLPNNQCVIPENHCATCQKAMLQYNNLNNVTTNVKSINPNILEDDIKKYFLNFLPTQPPSAFMGPDIPNNLHESLKTPLNNSPEYTQTSKTNYEQENACRKTSSTNNLPFILNRFKARYCIDDQQTDSISSKGILKYLYDSFLEQENCDFIVKTKSGDVMSHQLVVAAFSPSVDSYLKSQKKKFQQPLMVNLEECSLEAVANVLNFLYTTDITLNSLNIGFISNVSVRLDIPLLNHVSNDYLVQTLDKENAFLHLSVSMNNKYLSALHIFKFIALNFSEIIDHEHLLLLPFESFYTLLTHPSLRVKEVELFLSIANWINFNRASRMKHNKMLLSLVNFHRMDPHQLARYVENQGWLFSNDDNKKIILDAYK